MSAKVKHIHLPYTTYHLCKKDGGYSSNKTNANCKTCLKLYKRHKDMIKELSEFKEFLVGQTPVFGYLFSEKEYTQEKANEIVDMLGLAEDVYLNLKGLSQMNT